MINAAFRITMTSAKDRRVSAFHHPLIVAAGLAATLTLALTSAPLRAEDEVFHPASPLDLSPAPADEPLSISRPTGVPSEGSRSLQPKPRKVRVIAIDARANATRERGAFYQPEAGPANSRAADALIATRDALALKAPSSEKPTATPSPAVAALAPEPTAPKPLPATQEFCASIADQARERRAAYQAERFRELEEQLNQRIAELDQRRAEVKQWLDRQKEAERKADESVIAIFSRMRPEAAAAQLSAADEATAAAVLAKLNPRTASAILNEIDAAKAAKLTDAISKTKTAQLQPQSVSQ